MKNNSHYFYLNGDIVPEAQAQLHVSDLGLLRGYGIFDFFRAVDGRPIFMEDHLDRFEHSARKLFLDIPVTRQQLREAILTLIEHNAEPLLGLKMILTGGYSPDGFAPTTPNLFIIAKPFQFASAQGLKLLLVEHLREMSDVKTLNYLQPIWQIPAMRQAGCQDVLYHHEGRLSELSRSNLFLVKNETIITPNTDILFGVTRKHTLALARQHFQVEERPVALDELWTADEVFTTGSTKRIIPITEVNGQAFTSSKVISHLQALFLSHEQQS
jgi:branched-chain amino acid aminotransferase